MGMLVSLCFPFWIDVLDQKDAIQTAIRFPNAEQAQHELKDGLRLSWVLIDLVGLQAMDLSSHAPVSVQRLWLMGELHTSFAMVVEAGEGGLATEAAQCGAVVTCGGWAEEEGEGMQVREVSQQVEDGDGTYLSLHNQLP
ncbi:probable F-box protein At2g36090 [Rhodamnia argentea]|uniref:Probable F-box protein At2g36090 n=1 Tax=Rhodamnia argentea TaxID=178133 RepID=A0ABM3GYJ1_9MYRT|nr:probable F-box protein At2g36090 [Rhodamnia argentea]